MESTDILALNDWTPETFKLALKDLRRVEANETSPELEEAITHTLKMLAAHLTRMRLFGRNSILRGYSSMIGELFMRHPGLPRQRDLSLAARVGVRLEMILEDLLQAEAVPTVDKAKAALGGSKNVARFKMVQTMVEAGDWVDTARLIKISGTTKQNVNLAIQTFKKLGLVVSRVANGGHIYRSTDLAAQTVEELKKQVEEPKSVEEPPRSIFNAIMAREKPSANVGIRPPVDLLTDAAAIAPAR